MLTTTERDHEVRLGDVEITVDRRWPVIVAFATMGAALLLLVIAVQQDRTAELERALLAAGAAVPLIVALLVAAAKWPVRLRAAVSVESRQLFVKGKRVLGRGAIRSAATTAPGPNPLVVVAGGWGRRLTMRLSSPGDADRVLAALGQTAEQTTTTFRCELGRSSRSLRLVLFMTAAAFLDVLVEHLVKRAGLHLPVIGPVLFAAAAGLAGVSRTCAVVLGQDGFEVRRFARPAFFVPFSRVSEVRRDAEEAAVVVSLANGATPLRFAYARSPHWLGKAASAPRELPLYERLQAGVESEGDGEGRSHPARAFLVKGSSSRREWMRRVEELTRRPDQYRLPSVPTEELWSVLADPHEAAEVRAAAAAAIRHQLDDARRERLRVTTDATADAPLRRVFTAIADRDEHALEEAFDGLETVPGQMSVRREVST